MKLTAGVVLLILAKFAFLHGESGESTLKSVQLVFRHGKKEADNAFGVRTGLLTNEGKEEMYQLGKYMRNRYKDFIREIYDPTEFDILSSAANRCVQSGALFAYGFYEDYNRRANWSAEGKIPYEPIPVQTIPAKYDKYLQLTAECPKHGILKADFIDAVAKEVFAQFPDLINAYVQATGDKSPFNESLPWINRVFVIAPLIDTNSIANSETAPDWIKPFLENDIYNGFKRIYNDKLYYSGSKELKMLEVGPLYEMLYKRMNIQREASFKKLYVYPTHDFSVGALQSLFTPNIDAFPPDPPTGSAFIIELHQGSREESEAYIEVQTKLICDSCLEVAANEQRGYVNNTCKSCSHALKVYFRNDTTVEPRKMTQIPGCQTLCYVKQFGKVIEDLIPPNYEDLCKINEDSSNSTTHAIWIGVFVLVILTAVICVAIATVNSCIRRRRNYNRV